MALTQEDIDLASIALCQPLTAILNFSLFQYLLSVFASRRREPRVRLLLLVAFLGFVSLVPFAYPDRELVHSLNDISEVSSVLTFTLQIVILTKSVNKKMRLASIARLGRLAEILVALGLAMLLFNAASIIAPTAIGMDVAEILDLVVEYFALGFIMVFRFFFLSLARGWSHLWRHQKLEMVFYALLLTHAVPFHVLEHATGLEWNHVQALWLRITIALALSSTIRARLAFLSSLVSRSNHTTGVASQRDKKQSVDSVGPNADHIVSPAHSRLSSKGNGSMLTSSRSRLRLGSGRVRVEASSAARTGSRNLSRGVFRIGHTLSSRRQMGVVPHADDPQVTDL